MCENDEAVNVWVRQVYEWSTDTARRATIGAEPETTAYLSVTLRAGHFQGVIRELAATVPGVREWLLTHTPGDAQHGKG